MSRARHTFNPQDTAPSHTCGDDPLGLPSCGQGPYLPRVLVKGARAFTRPAGPELDQAISAARQNLAVGGWQLSGLHMMVCGEKKTSPRCIFVARPHCSFPHLCPCRYKQSPEHCPEVSLKGPQAGPIRQRPHLDGLVPRRSQEGLSKGGVSGGDNSVTAV